MNITKEDIKRISDVAKLDLNSDEQCIFVKELSGIIGMIRDLEQVDTKGAAKMISPGEHFNVFREDVVLPSLDQEEALLNAAEKEGAFFKVPRVMDAD